jgi:hypothetical protein
VSLAVGWKRLVLGLSVVGLLAVPVTAHAQTPSPSPSPPGVGSQPLVGNLPVVGGLPFVGKALSDAVKTLNPVTQLGKVTSSASHGLMHALVEAAGSMLTSIMGLLSENGGIDVFASWFTTQYAIVALIALPFLLWAAIVAAAQAAAFGTGMDVARAGLKALGAAFLMTMPVLIIVTAGLVLTDWATGVILSGAGVGLHENLQVFSDRLATLGGTNAYGASLFFAVVVVIVAVLGALFVWINLLVRKAALYVSVSLMPLALAGKSHPRSEGWTKKLSTLTAAVIASKFIIALVLALAVSWFASGDTANVGNDLVFGIVLLIAGFLPLLLLRAAGSVLEVHQAGKLLAAKGEAASLIKRPFSAVRHASTLAFARGGGNNGHNMRQYGQGGGRRPPTKPRSAPRPVSQAPRQSPKVPSGGAQRQPVPVGAPAAKSAQRRGGGAAQPTWWPTGAKPLAPGQPRPPQTRAPAPKPVPPPSTPPKPPLPKMPAPGTAGSAFPWFRLPKP